MGWISGGTDLSATANLYSNHPLYFKSGTGFKSETMIYEGQYIAYFPYLDTKKIAPLTFDLSKQNSEDYAKSGLAKRWRVSEELLSLTNKTAGLAKDVKITLVPLTNLLKLNIKLPADATVPADFKVKGVKLASTKNKLVKSLTFLSASVKEGAFTSTDWSEEKGNIEVSVGTLTGAAGKETTDGLAVSKDNGLDIFVQLGALAAADNDAALTVETNYGEVSIKEAENSVVYKLAGASSKEVKVASLVAALNGLGTDLETKTLGNNMSINATLDMGTVQLPTTVSCQADLDKILTLADQLGYFAKGGDKKTITLELKKSKLLKKDGVVEADGDIILTDLTKLNTFKGTLTISKSATDAPTNVYVSGELALSAKATPLSELDFICSER